MQYTVGHIAGVSLAQLLVICETLMRYNVQCRRVYITLPLLLEYIFKQSGIARTGISFSLNILVEIVPIFSMPTTGRCGHSFFIFSDTKLKSTACIFLCLTPTVLKITQRRIVKVKQKDLGWMNWNEVKQEQKTMMDGSCCCVALCSTHRSEEDEQVGDTHGLKPIKFYHQLNTSYRRRYTRRWNPVVCIYI